MEGLHSLKKNLKWQTLFQVFNTCMPLFTAPYLARTLGAAQLGVFSYTSSIVACFLLLAMLGTMNYGTRAIAAVKDDRALRSRVFWEIYALQLGTALLATLLYVVYMTTICGENRQIAWLQMLQLVSCFFGINWLYFGLEAFMPTVVRSMIVKLASVILIFALVKKPEDLWLYTTIMVGGTLLSECLLFIRLPRYVMRIKPSLARIKGHIAPNLLLFIPLLAMSVYHITDKMMLGLLSTYEESGYYYYADKVVNIPLGVLSGVGTVMLPRMTHLIHSDNQHKMRQLFLFSVEGVAALGIAMASGIVAISKEFVPVFFGEGYAPVVLLLILMSPILVIKGFSLSARMQYLVPLNREPIYVKSVFIGAGVNLAANLALIPKLGATGAAIGTLAAELSACLYQYNYIRREVSIRALMISSAEYLLCGFIMIAGVRCAARLPVELSFAKLMIEIAAGIMIYCVLCFSIWRLTDNKLQNLISPLITRRP